MFLLRPIINTSFMVYLFLVRLVQTRNKNMNEVKFDQMLCLNKNIIKTTAIHSHDLTKLIYYPHNVVNKLTNLTW